MTGRVRRWLFLAAGGALGALLAWAFLGLPRFGELRSPYGRLLASLASSERQSANAVTAVLFDFRGLDTLGEELILFAAVAGVALLLRPLPGEEEEPPEEDLPGHEAPETSGALQAFGFPLAGVTALYGLLLVARSHLSPGGGFQGGVMVAAALLLVYLVSDFRVVTGLAPKPALEHLEGLGIGAYLLLGLGGLLAGGGFLTNFLPAGRLGELASGGLIPFLSASAGLAVGAGTVLLVADFLEQTLMIREHRWHRPGRGADGRR